MDTIRYQVFRSPLILFWKYSYLKISREPSRRIEPAEYQRYLGEIISIAQHANVKVLLIIEPSIKLGIHQPAIAPYIRLLQAVAHKHHIPVVNPLPEMSIYNPGDMFMDYIHLTGFGHKIMADAVYPQLVSSVQGE